MTGGTQVGLRDNHVYYFRLFLVSFSIIVSALFGAWPSATTEHPSSNHRYQRHRLCLVTSDTIHPCLESMAGRVARSFLPIGFLRILYFRFLCWICCCDLKWHLFWYGKISSGISIQAWQASWQTSSMPLEPNNELHRTFVTVHTHKHKGFPSPRMSSIEVIPAPQGSAALWCMGSWVFLRMMCPWKMDSGHSPSGQEFSLSIFYSDIPISEYVVIWL